MFPGDTMSQSLQPSRPTEEALALQAEWRETPPTPARAEAEHALAWLSQAAADTTRPPAKDDVPPLPDDLRAKWEGIAGAVAPPRVTPVVSREKSAAPSRWRRLVETWLTPRGLAYAGGACAAALALGLFLAHEFGTPGGSEGATGGPTVIRGGTSGVDDGAPAPVLLVVPETLATAAEAAEEELARAFPEREISRVDTSDAAMAAAELRPRLVIIDLSTRTVTAWSGGELSATFALGDSGSVISRLEDADEKLETDPRPER